MAHCDLKVANVARAAFLFLGRRKTRKEGTMFLRKERASSPVVTMQLMVGSLFVAAASAPTSVIARSSAIHHLLRKNVHHRKWVCFSGGVRIGTLLGAAPRIFEWRTES